MAIFAHEIISMKNQQQSQDAHSIFIYYWHSNWLFFAIRWILAIWYSLGYARDNATSTRNEKKEIVIDENVKWIPYFVMNIWNWWNKRRNNKLRNSKLNTPECALYHMQFSIYNKCIRIPISNSNSIRSHFELKPFATQILFVIFFREEKDLNCWRLFDGVAIK